MANSTIEIFEEVKATLGGVSDTKAAAALGVTKQAVSNWRAGATKTMSDDAVIAAARILKRPVGELLALAAAERAATEAARKEWTKLAAKIRATAAVGIITALGITGFQNTKAAETAAYSSEVCILC